MKKYLALVKLLFVRQYKARGSASDGAKRKRGAIALYVLLALCFAPVVISIAVAMYYLGEKSQGNVHVATFLILMCQGLVLVFGVHAIISNVFVVKDAERLLYLPISSQVIFWAKMTVAYLNEVITTAATAATVLLPFGLGAGVGFGYYAMLVVALLLLPMLPMLLGALIAMPISALVTLFGKNSAVKTILRIVLYAAIMGLYMYAMYSFGFFTGADSGNFLTDPEAYIDVLQDFIVRLQTVMPYFHPDYMFARGMLANGFIEWIVGFASSLCENLALLALVFALSLPFYRKMLSASVEGGGVHNKAKATEALGFKKRSAVQEFMITDLRRTVRDAQLGFQSFAGIIMMPIIVVILYFFLGISDSAAMSFLELMQVSRMYRMVAPILILVYMTFLGCCTNVLGLYPISRENKSAFVLKSLPVRFSTILLSKVLLATAVMLISDFVTCVLIVALFGLDWYLGIAMLAVMVLVGFGAMCVTTLFDLKNPRFGWENFDQGLKNAKNSWLAMLVAFLSCVALTLCSVPFVIIYAVWDEWYIMLGMWIVDLAVAGTFAGVAYKIMQSRAAEYFERIEV